MPGLIRFRSSQCGDDEKHLMTIEKHYKGSFNNDFDTDRSLCITNHSLSLQHTAVRSHGTDWYEI